MSKLTRFGDLVIGLSLTTGALVCVAIAYTPYVEAMFIEFVLQGTAETFIAIGKYNANKPSLMSHLEFFHKAVLNKRNSQLCHY